MIVKLKSLLNKDSEDIQIFEDYQFHNAVDSLISNGEVFIVLENGSILEIFDVPNSPYQYNILSCDSLIDTDSLEIDYDSFLLDGGIMKEGLGASSTIEFLTEV